MVYHLFFFGIPLLLALRYNESFLVASSMNILMVVIFCDPARAVPRFYLRSLGSQRVVNLQLLRQSLSGSNSWIEEKTCHLLSHSLRPRVHHTTPILNRSSLILPITSLAFTRALPVIRPRHCDPPPSPPGSFSAAAEHQRWRSPRKRSRFRLSRPSRSRDRILPS